jgi:hypothetical protein
VNEKLLRIYLQDHHAGSTTGLELARRAHGNNKGNEYGAALAKIVDEIAADQKALESIMDELGFGADKIKDIGAWALEKAGRLKLNGQITGYSPLSRLVELEGLWMGIEGKLSMWRALLAIAEDDERLDRLELEALATRAEEQLQRLGKHRGPVARDALAA